MLDAIVSLLENAGMVPWTDRTRLPLEGKDYPIIKRRIYDSDDLIGFDLLQLLPDAFITLTETDDGRLRLGRREGGRSNGILRQAYGGQRIIVSARVRSVLEAAELDSVALKPVYADKHNTISDDWSELTSLVRMPPLAPSMHLIGFYPTRGPVQPGFQGGSWIAQDGFVEPAELRYRAADVEEWSHDLALTTEGRIDAQRRIVASRRLYETLVSAGIETNWMPVFVE
jgi:hypothetical protein